MAKNNLKPHKLAWAFYTFCSRIMLKVKNNLKIDNKVFRKRNKKEGCLVIYNHASNSDHFISTASFQYAPANYVITKHFYFNKTLRKILTIVQAIPRDQFKSDLLSIKKMKKSIDEGGIVAIAPAGQITINGEMPYIDRAIVKLIKLCKCDIYTLQIHGNYLAQPKWSVNKRKFPIKTKLIKLISKSDLSNLSDDEIYVKVISSININDREEQKITPKKIKGKNLIEGLEKIIYYCPKCHSMHTFVTSGNQMICTICGNKIIMNQYGSLEKGSQETIMFEDEAKWYQYEKELVKKQIINKTLYIEEKFSLQRNLEEEFSLKTVGEGKLVLTNDEFYYEGTINGEIIKYEFDLNNIFQLPFSPAVRLDVPSHDGMFQFTPLGNPNQLIEYVQAIDAMRELKSRN